MIIKETTTHLFTQVTNIFRSELEKHLTTIGLHSGQIFILINLWKKDGISQIDIAKKLNLSPPTINKMVKSLQTNGFIKCSKCKMDGRITRIHLTQKGIDHKILVEEKWQEFEDTFYKGLNETERLIFLQLLGKIKNSFDSLSD